MRLSLLGLCVLSLNAAANQTLAVEPIDYFAQGDQWSDVAISPDGRYLSASTYVKGKNVIAVIDAKTLEPKQSIKFNGPSEPGDYHWVNNERMVAKKMYLSSYSEAPYTYSEFYAFNADGSNSRYVFGARSGNVSRGRFLWGDVLTPMPEDDDYMMVVGTPMSHIFDITPTIYRVNINNGRHYVVMRSPLRRPTFLTDNKHQIRFASGYDDEHRWQTLLYTDDKWLGTKDLDIANESFEPIALSDDLTQVYALYNADDGPLGLYRFDLTTGNKETIFQSQVASIDQVYLDTNQHPYAATVDEGTPTTVILDSDNQSAKILKKLMKRLNGFNVEIVSETLDGNKKVILATNQYTPGDYLIYDKRKDRIDYLFAKRPWIDPNKSANVVPFHFATRDGLKLLAYITLPRGIESLKEAKNMPLLVNVHGGPHSSRDRRVYDSENQFYAANGIAVLQVNFRGSAGFGHGFIKKGFGHWGDSMQHDIIDGVKAAIAQGYVDADKMCISGHSFGGYSAMQSSILQPRLFRCAVALSGVYDLTLLKEKGKAANNEIDRDILDIYLGTDEARLKAMSPTYNVSKLQTPVLVFHSGRDKRAPLEHAESLVKQLKQHKKDYQFVELERSEHQLYSAEVKAEVLTKSLDFIKRHLQL